MNRLYSPWCSAYITTFEGDNESRRFPFCSITKDKKDERDLVIWWGKDCYLIMNLYVYNNGHLMVVPYLHTSDIGSLPDEANADIES